MQKSIVSLYGKHQQLLEFFFLKKPATLHKSMDVDPPSQQEPVNPSYVQKLLHDILFLLFSTSSASADLADEITSLVSDANFIPISTVEKLRIYSPWKKISNHKSFG